MEFIKRFGIRLVLIIGLGSVISYVALASVNNGDYSDNPDVQEADQIVDEMESEMQEAEELMDEGFEEMEDEDAYYDSSEEIDWEAEEANDPYLQDYQE
jgi:hypothetical protein